MSFLAPALLGVAAAVAVPLLLHLLHRSEGRRMAFPALRYLLRTEKDHARRIRSRQLLLLMLRSAAVLLAALGAARLVIRGSGPAHPPTAVALVLDNSLSSGRVVGEARVLDSLRSAALAAVDQAAPGDLFWVLRAGEPWALVEPLSPTAARERILATEVTGTAGDLTATLERARGLLDAAPLEVREIHLLSDLQATGFSGGPPRLDGLPVVVRTGLAGDTVNRYVRNAAVGGGLTPRANRRTEVAVSVGGSVADSTSVPVRLFLADQLRGAASTPPGGTALLPAGPFPQGRLEGYAETDPDDLRADDRFWISLVVAPPPAVAVVGTPGPYLAEGLQVLEEAGRIRRTGASEADVLVLESGVGVESLLPEQRAVVLPGPDAALRTALTRRLQEAGVPVRMEGGPGGESRISADETGTELVGTTVVRRRALVLVDPAPGGSGVQVRVRLEDGSPWLVEGRTARGASVRLLGSRLDPSETSLPLDAAMVPFLEWLLSGPGGVSGSRRVEAGQPLLLPVRATHVEDPAGTRSPVDGTHEFRSTGSPGIYTVLAGDEVLDRIAVNAPLRESLLAPLSGEALQELLADGTPVLASDAGRWRSAVFTERRGREIWPWLLGAALLVLLVESWVASTGGTVRSRPRVPVDAPRAQNA